jgi:hypothetical protein
MKQACVSARGFLWMLALAAIATAGCSAGGGGAIADAHPVDAYEVSLDLPAGCPPDAGNQKGIGKPCTPGGNECTGNANEIFRCTCDQFLTIKLVGVPCICTILTLNNSSDLDAGDLCASQASTVCGNGASCCAYQTTGTYCVPNICLPGGACPIVNL